MNLLPLPEPSAAAWRWTVQQLPIRFTANARRIRNGADHPDLNTLMQKHVWEVIATTDEPLFSMDILKLARIDRKRLGDANIQLGKWRDEGWLKRTGNRRKYAYQRAK